MSTSGRRVYPARGLGSRNDSLRSLRRSMNGREGPLARPFPAALYLLGVAIVLSAAVLSIARAARDRANLATDGARWIWFKLDFPEPAPIRFRAWREFHLD